MKEGDCNSRYFHLLVNASRRGNTLQGLWIDGEWVEESASVKEAACLFFLQRFQEVDHNRPHLDGIEFQSIDHQHNDMLTGRFLEEEIKEAAWGYGSEKSLGPDGINFKFIKRF